MVMSLKLLLMMIQLPLYLISAIHIFNDDQGKHWVAIGFQDGEVKLFDSHFRGRISVGVKLRCMVPWLAPMDCWSLLLLYSSSHHVPSIVDHYVLQLPTMQQRVMAWLKSHLMKANSGKIL